MADVLGGSYYSAADQPWTVGAPEEASGGFDIGGLFKAVSPYLNAFTDAAVNRGVGYILGERRDNPTLGFTASQGPQRSVAYATGGGLMQYLPWGVLFGVGIVAVMMLGGKR